MFELLFSWLDHRPMDAKNQLQKNPKHWLTRDLLSPLIWSRQYWIHLLHSPAFHIVAPTGGGRDEDLREDGPRAERVAQDQDRQVRRSAQRGKHDTLMGTEFIFVNWTNYCVWSVIYRAEKKSLQIVLSSTQAGPGRKVRQEQKEISRNHVPRLFLGSVDQYKNCNSGFQKH